CLRLPAYSASAKVICFIIEKLGDWCPGILPNQEVFFRISFENQQPKSYKCNYFGMKTKLDNQKKNKEGFAELEHTTIGESQST
ncbi:hypothetical protein, partial [Pseudomonas shirazica]|uniref:hypothetical protein n=1 Tax=Pseudomonas shirazica TaxID=1940636 RepID=UPI003AAF4F42